ncbi:uncharacterized protein LOC143574899 [Bidens hawaiensis]|uniref:uncharacterized protein LOC143574899 n=1 Tax=Bidens hawaiensis TaxID=980011 RepID=UPI0040499312
MEASVVKLKPIEATPETFKDYGQVVQASADGDDFGPHDAQLDLSQGTPRFVPPTVDSVRVFKITGPKFLILNSGTWHAGPLFKPDTMDFYNLELSNTNVVDHTSHDFEKENATVFLINE